MKVHATISVGTALTIFLVISLTGLLYYFGKKDLAVGAGIVGALLTALLPRLLNTTNGIEIEAGKDKTTPPPKV